MSPPDLGSRRERAWVAGRRSAAARARPVSGELRSSHRGPWRLPSDARVSASRETGALGRPSSAPPAVGRGRRCVTPRQACPRLGGLGRNLRSKTRWFAGFCNSHQVSHFATFFIDARAEISVAESHFAYASHNTGAAPGGARVLSVSLARLAPGVGCCTVRARGPGDGGVCSQTGPRVISFSGHRQ